MTIESAVATASETIATRRDRERGRSRNRVKGVVAIAAGAVLLLGGGTTLAYWSTTQTLDAGTIESGDLNLSLGTGTWTIDGAIGGPAPVADPSAVRIVPGDVLTLTQPVTVTLVGDTIQGLLAVDAADAIPAAAAGAFTVDLSMSGGVAEGADTYRFTPATAGTVTATVTITFDSATANRDLVNTPLDLSAVEFTLTQASS
jgi:alternate signal-mediated exported protein